MPATFAGASTTNLSTYAANPPGAQTPAASPLRADRSHLERCSGSGIWNWLHRVVFYRLADAELAERRSGDPKRSRLPSGSLCEASRLP